ncbi:MAG: hypothetical protein ACKVH8_02155 [Pirellulales bacterium]
MIYYLVSSRHSCTFSPYFEDWGKPVQDLVKTLYYEDLDLQKPFAPGLYIFTDHERLLRPEMKIIKQLASQMEQYPSHFRIFNNPNTALTRFKMLESWYESDINQSRAYRIDSLPEDIKFPVFTKREFDHTDRTMRLARSKDELHHVLRRLTFRERLRRREMMLLEYCDVSDGQGVFQKYSIMRIGDYYVPKHIHSSKEWITKHSEILSDEINQEEFNYIRAAAAPEDVKRGFEIAGLEYGRMDYGLKDGKVQIWEINSNPVVLPTRESLDPKRVPGQAESARQINKAYQQVNFSPDLEPILLFQSSPVSWQWKMARVPCRFYGQYIRK